MKICIFQTGEPLHIDKGNYRPMRCMLIADKLIESGHDVYIISSAFFHQRKVHRSNSNRWIKVSKNLKIYLIPSIGYKRHIGLIRVFDHMVLAFNLFIFLRKNKQFKPDKLFLGYPPILTSFILTNWCIKNKIPLILDVKDKWPEHFIYPIPKYGKTFMRVLLTPYFIIARYVFRKATKITSITEEYLEWIKNFSKNKYEIKSRYFLSPLIRKQFDLSIEELNQSLNFWSLNKINLKEEKYFCFIGSYTKSFDFNFIYKMATILGDEFPDILFILCGSGDQYKNIIKKFSKLSNVKVFGEIDKFQAKVLISNCIATLAPYVNNKNFRNHIPNKIIESLENNKPFITTLDGKLRSIIKNHNNGIFIRNKDPIDMCKFENILKNKDYLRELEINAEKSYKILFDYKKTFDNIEKNLINI